MKGIILGSQTLCSHIGVASQDWHKTSATVSDTGNQTVIIDLTTGTEHYYNQETQYLDHLLICISDTLTVTGLLPNQKISLFRSMDNAQVDSTKTVAGGATSVTFDLSAEEFPEDLYLKVTGIDGTTVIETTNSQSMCGGDSWAWTVPETIPLRIVSSQRIIYRTAATATPKTAYLTATLLQQNGDPYVGKTVTLDTSLGTLTSTSGVTDASGNVTTELTGLTHGPAVVHAYFPGDTVVPPSTELIKDLQAATWTVGTGWAAPAGTLNKNADGTGTAYPTTELTVHAGSTYKVVITLSACTVGSCSYTLGGTAGTTTLSSAATYTHYITATTTGNLIFTPSASNSRFTISAVSVKEILAADAYVTVHIFDEAEAPDASKKFQFYCEGIEYPALAGSYASNGEGVTEAFEVETDQWYNTAAFFGLVSIYRLGVKEFTGSLLGAKRTLSENPQVKLSGSDISYLLGLRLVDYELYTSKTPLEIVTSLLSKYPSGIEPGAITAATTVTIEFNSVSLLEAIMNICDLIGGVYRVNSDFTLDLDTSFGEAQAVAFTEGTDILHGELTLS